MCEACHVVMKTKSPVVTLTVFYFKKNISRYAFTLDLFDLLLGATQNACQRVSVGLTVSCKMDKILTYGRKSHHPIESPLL